MISVIVPIYNVEEYLPRCIDSIINQTYKDLEIILVDDGSPDNCGHICDEYAKKDKRIKVVHQENGGLSAARNTGIKNATGEYIAFVDSDDYIAQDMYELLYGMIEDGKYDIAICGHKVIYEDENFSQPQECENIYLDKNSLWQEVFGCLNNAAWNKLYRKNLMVGINFPTKTIHGEDLIFNLNYLKNCETGVLNKSPKYCYVQRKGSITQSGFSKKKLMEVSAKDMAFEIVKECCPEQILNAKKFCFRARMNLIRAIIRADRENEYAAELHKFKKYINENYKSVKIVLSAKEKIEYHLFNKICYAYKLVIKKLF